MDWKIDLFYVNMIIGGVVGFILVVIHRWLIWARSRERAQKAFDVAQLSRMKMPEVRALCFDNVPGWIAFPDFERVHFINKILKKLWPFINKATSTVVREVVEPILAQYKPAGVQELGFDKCTLGDVAPMVAGIRFLKMYESQIILDVDFKWGGNPSIILGIQTVAVRLPVQLKALKVFATARIILELTGKIPCVGAAVASLLVKPKPLVGHTLKAVGGSLTAIPGVAGLIDEIIQGVLTDTVVWPKRVVIPLIPGFDTSHLELKVEGKLYVDVVKATGLKNVDLVGSSDPFVVLWTRPRYKEKTKHILNDLNPEWNESFQMEVEEFGSAHLTIKVRDEGIMADQFLGQANFEISKLLPDVQTDVAIWLLPDIGSDHLPPNQSRGLGRLFLRLKYHPYSPAEQEEVVAREKAILEAAKNKGKAPGSEAPPEESTSAQSSSGLPPDEKAA